MAFNINDIRSQLAFGGARPSLFQVTITNPINPVADIKVPFLCETAQIPASDVGIINVSYFGRIVKLPGVRAFEPWTVTIINDEDFAIRNTLEEWHNSINLAEQNLATNGSAPGNYKSQATVTQYAKDGSELRVYQFNGFWPSTISPIDLSWAAGDEIERFSVTWQYDNYEVVAGTTGNGGGA